MKTTVRQAHTSYGRVWRVTYPCDCTSRTFRQWHVAMVFANNHHCPSPWTPIPSSRPYVRGGVR